MIQGMNRRSVRTAANATPNIAAPTCHTLPSRCASLCKRAAYVLFALVLTVSFSMMGVQNAFADYLNPKITTTAQVQTDGSLRVVEQRAFAFEEAYGAIWWNISGISADAKVTLNSVRYATLGADGSIEGEWTALPEIPFQTSWRGAITDTEGIAAKMDLLVKENASDPEDSEQLQFPEGNAVSFDARRQTIYAFMQNMPMNIAFECDYTIANAVRVFDDVAELYWDYIAVRDDVEMENVKTTIVLPLPEGIEVAPGQNVQAWGHGPEGSVEIFPNGTIVFDVAKVLPGQYAQAHVLFPQSWLGNLPLEMKIAYSGTRLDQAVQEELAWTDTWSSARSNAFYLDLVVMLICAFVLIGSIVVYALFGRDRRLPDEEVAREVPAVGPAVLGRLLRSNHESTDDIVAALIGAIDDGIIQAEVVSPGTSCLGEGYSNVRFRLSAQAKDRLTSATERETLRLLFEVCAEGYPSVSIDEIIAYSKRNPEAFKKALISWQETLDGCVADARVFDARSKKAQTVLAVVAIACALVAIGAFALAGNTFATILFAIAALIVAFIANDTKRLTPKGNALDERARAFAARIAQDASISGDSVKECVPVIVLLGIEKEIAKKIIDPTDEETLWIMPCVGRGGRSIICLARRFSEALAKAFSASCK